MPDDTKTDWAPYFGDYALFGELGRGATGVVYAAQHPRLKKQVALKILHGDFAATRQGAARLRVEAEAVSRLDHANIVPILEVGEHDGQPFLVMGLIEGGSLAERISPVGPPMPPCEAAALVAKIARAVHHAHERAVLHRDLKPGNILLDRASEPYLIDFGIAKCLDLESGMTRTGAFLGTPAYASPEQAAGNSRLVTTASDIYGLGAILYAVLTGGPPFSGETSEIIQQVLHEAPTSLRKLHSAVPRDLETVCFKCLEKEPGRRYASALNLAEDLERFLGGSPILARSVGPAERLWLWARREPALAFLASVVFLLLVVGILSLSLWSHARAENQRREIQNQRRELRTQQLVNTRLASREAGWATKGWNEAREAASSGIGGDRGELRNQAVALLAGLDALQVTNFTRTGASSIAFDREGTRVLMGGLDDGTKLWQPANAMLQVSSRPGPGPVAFGRNGEPLQLAFDSSRQAFVLINLNNSETIREWRTSSPSGFREVGTNRIPLAALSRDGSSAVVGLDGPDGQGLVAMLRVDESGTVDTVGVLSRRITAVTISDDASLVAAAESEGNIHVWSVGDKTSASIFADRAPVSCLSLKRSRHVADPGKGISGEPWLLAEGDAGGNITVWDLRTKQALARCHSGSEAIYALAFSPDGATLASGGRNPLELWDVATGRLLLDIPQDFVSCLDFSPDGKRLAIGIVGCYASPRSCVYQLEYGRGIQSLRGLSGMAERVCLSTNAHLVAGLSHNWEIGVWDLETGELLRVFEAPWGENSDNASILFTREGDRLAFSGHRSARVWDLASGAETVSRELPCGLVEILAAPESDHVLLFRAETLDGKECPYGLGVDRTAHPIVCRVRDLLNPNDVKTLEETRDFNFRVLLAAAVLDGRIFVVSGLHEERGERRRAIKAFNGLEGTQRWSVASTKQSEGFWDLGQPSASSIVFESTPGGILIDAASGREGRALPEGIIANCLEDGLYAVSPEGNRAGGFSVFDRTARLIVRLGIDTAFCSRPRFDPSGRFFAWGNADGSVTVCDLKEINSRLARIGLGR